MLVGLFLLKVAVALAYGWFYNLPQYLGKNDTWQFFKISCMETEMLLNNPVGFVKDFFSYGYAESGNLFSGVDSYWNDLKTNAFTKLLGIINVFTVSSYWADLVWLNFLYFFGPVAFYRIFKNSEKATNLLLIVAVFCLPSFIFWYSGLHKDGIIFAAFCMAVYQFNKMTETGKVKFLSLAVFFLSLLIVFAFRNYVVLLMVPALMVWWLCNRYPSKKLTVVLSIYGICLAVFFTAPLLSASLDFPGYIVTKQQEFRSLEGNSQIVLPALLPNFAGFIRFLPNAIDIAILRPHINELENPAYWPSILENIFLYGWLLFVLLKVEIKPSKEKSGLFPLNGFVIFCYCFAISFLLLSGYTVTLTAAIVRYRGFVLPLIFAPLALGLRVKQNKL